MSALKQWNLNLNLWIKRNNIIYSGKVELDKNRTLSYEIRNNLDYTFDHTSSTFDIRFYVSFVNYFFLKKSFNLFCVLLLTTQNALCLQGDLPYFYLKERDAEYYLLIKKSKMKKDFEILFIYLLFGKSGKFF